MIKCNSLWKLAKDLSTNQHPVDLLPASSKRLLYKALVLAGSASFEDSNTKDNYWQLVCTGSLYMNHAVVVQSNIMVCVLKPKLSLWVFSAELYWQKPFKIRHCNLVNAVNWNYLVSYNYVWQHETSLLLCSQGNVFARDTYRAELVAAIFKSWAATAFLALFPFKHSSR